MEFFQTTTTMTDDPTEFRQTEIQVLDACLRCPICREFYVNPVITTCFHSFCSRCIREAIDTDVRDRRSCPICGEKISSEGNLRMNTALEVSVDAYKNARPLILSLSKRPERTASLNNSSDPDSRSTKRKRDIEVIDLSDDEVEEKGNSGVAKSELSLGKQGSIGGTEGSSVPLVLCPICQKDIPELTINEHIDSLCKNFLEPMTSSRKLTVPSANNNNNNHTNKTSGSRSEDRSSGSLNLGSRSRSPTGSSSAPPAKRLAKLNYHTMTEKQLRALLAEHSLSTVGTKPVITARHQRWVLLFNANLDGAHPRKTSDLRTDLRKWEEARERESKAKERKEKAGPVDDDAYQELHKSDFKALEEEIRARMKAAKERREKENADIISE